MTFEKEKKTEIQQQPKSSSKTAVERQTVNKTCQIVWGGRKNKGQMPVKICEIMYDG